MFTQIVNYECCDTRLYLYDNILIAQQVLALPKMVISLSFSELVVEADLAVKEWPLTSSLTRILVH